jgi:hypothetical protein
MFLFEVVDLTAAPPSIQGLTGGTVYSDGVLNDNGTCQVF